MAEGEPPIEKIPGQLIIPGLEATSTSDTGRAFRALITNVVAQSLYELALAAETPDERARWGAKAVRAKEIFETEFAA